MRPARDAACRKSRFGAGRNRTMDQLVTAPLAAVARLRPVGVRSAEAERAVRARSRRPRPPAGLGVHKREIESSLVKVGIGLRALPCSVSMASGRLPRAAWRMPRFAITTGLSGSSRRASSSARSAPARSPRRPRQVASPRCDVRRRQTRRRRPPRTPAPRARSHRPAARA